MKKENKKNKSVKIYITEEKRNMYDELAKKQGMSISKYIGNILNNLENIRK